MNFTNIVAHSTEYNQVVFRSRLEARWAATFDLLGWRWEYEPFDLDGWVPDFRLNLPKCNEDYYGTHYVRTPDPFVEIRPVDFAWDCPLQEFGIDRIYRALEVNRNEEGDLARRSSGLVEVLLLGNNMEAFWKIPDLGLWDEPMHLGLVSDPLIWNRAGSAVQWKGSANRAKAYV